MAEEEALLGSDAEMMEGASSDFDSEAHDDDGGLPVTDSAGWCRCWRVGRRGGAQVWAQSAQSASASDR